MNNKTKHTFPWVQAGMCIADWYKSYSYRQASGAMNVGFIPFETWISQLRRKRQDIFFEV